ncbi:MAG: 2-hydroxyglutaryl-CoA dehydratase [Deltaproteobacteria bacterium]|nr:2-hydroxyglutaryl-CoA dehydratase [Deltaproteobacteria bacterium]
MATPKRLKASERMKELMLRQFQAGWLARAEGRKVAFVTSGAPVEYLIAMDVFPVYPENHGAVCGVARAGGRLCQTAEERGYSRDLCSYWKIDWGARTCPAKSPTGGLPVPDFLLCANNICRTVIKWYEGLARFYRVPLLLLDMPFRHAEEEPAAREYVLRQFRNLPQELSRLTGRIWDEERFEESFVLSAEASALWQECIDANSARPAPATAADQFLLMGPIVTMRGTREAVEFYRGLRDEIRERVKRGVGSVEGEKTRLLWDNLPVWHQLRSVTEFLSDRGAVLVGATYTNAWTERPKESLPVQDALADAYARVWLNMGLRHREEGIRRMAALLFADGVIFHSNRSCKPYSFGQEEVAARLQSDGVPCILMDGDMADERDHAAGGWRTRLEAYLERLENRTDPGGTI